MYVCKYQERLLSDNDNGYFTGTAKVRKGTAEKTSLQTTVSKLGGDDADA